MTSNESIESLQRMLNDANYYHPNIKLTYEIGDKANFLDLHIKNTGQLIATSVHHKDAAEPYVLPFKSDHPRHAFGNVISTALSRALRYSSTLQQFNHERRLIKLMLLYNG